MPVVFGTAYECLFTAGNLAEGQTALIHAGAAGVGMVAILVSTPAICGYLGEIIRNPGAEP